MLDLSTLRPRDNSPTAVAAAIARTEVAGRAVAAELTRLRAEHASLLVTGSLEHLASAEAEIEQLKRDGDRVLALHAELQRMFTAATSTTTTTTPKPTEETARGHALTAAAEFATWSAQNGATMTRGLQLLGRMTEAITAWHVVAGQQAAPPSNVVTLAPPPGAA